MVSGHPALRDHHPRPGSQATPDCAWYRSKVPRGEAKCEHSESGGVVVTLMPQVTSGIFFVAFAATIIEGFVFGFDCAFAGDNS